LPEVLYEKKYKQWVHPIYKGQRVFFNPRRHNAWNFSDAICFLALNDKEAVGRIMGIINHRVNKFHKIKESRFGFLDSINNQEIVSCLLARVEDWVNAKGYKYIVGPMGFANTDPAGILIEGYDERCSVGEPWHPSYLRNLVESAGYRKEIDWVTYHVDLLALPEVYSKIAARVLRNDRYELIEFSKRKEFKRWIKPVFALMNETYRNLYGFSPLTDAEIDKVIKEYLPVLDPRLVKLVANNGQLVGFAVGIPDFSKGIRVTRGRLYPFGIFKLIRERKRSKRLDLILGAIKEEHRGKGLNVLMANALFNTSRKMGLTHVDSHPELETNIKMRAEMERLGGRVYKRHRLYRKEL